MRAVDKYEVPPRLQVLDLRHLVDPQAYPRDRDQARTIRIPVHMIETMSKLRKVSKTLLQDNAREPTLEETAEAAHVSLDETRRVMRISRHPISLDRPVGESEDSYFGEFIEDDATDSPVDSATQGNAGKRSRQPQTLTYREREIIKLRYGLGDGYTYRSKSRANFQVTRERVRQIEAKAVRNCSTRCRSKQLKGSRCAGRQRGH